MRIADQSRSMRRQFRPKVGTFPSRKPQLVVLHLGIGTADHLEFEVGDNLLQLECRMLQEIARADQTRPSLPHNANTMVLLGRGSFASARPSSITATVPEASSSAPG